MSLKESGLEGAGVGVDTVQTFCMRASTVQYHFSGNQILITVSQAHVSVSSQ